ncbi:MAG TPA: hypothetical protein VN088_12570, partial [Nocardioides sp.]|nr:hypothetical protein [Nocardioides sp.]
IAGRLLRRPPTEPTQTVRLSEVHLGSLRGHAAQLATRDAPVRRLGPDALAEVLSRTSLSHAREIVESIDEEIGRRAVARLHPALRDRVSGRSGPPRRMLRSHGWRLHRPRGSTGGLR